MKEKANMYHNVINKKINNNRMVYASYSNNNKSNDNVREKINNIINSNNFIYSKMVNIIIGNDIIKRKIIGIYNNSLITIDNEYIPIDNINDIYI